jgi:predicted O-methyltransferase YrrM
LTRAAVSFLASWLKPSDEVLEFGSGRSTTWFARRVARVISIETSEQWHALVAQQLLEQGLSDRVRQVLVQKTPSSDFGARYLGAFAACPQAVDVALVDGELRDLCALQCIERVKPGGLLVVDNANWYLPAAPASQAPGSRTLDDGPATAAWQGFESATRHWRCYRTSDGVTDTWIWLRPAAG